MDTSKAVPPLDTEWLSGRGFLLLLGAGVCAAFPKVLLGLDTFFYRDYGFLCYPQAFYERESLLRGELPLWNPYIYCGIPFMAQWGAWYPSYFLSALFPMPWSVNFFQIVHMLLGGCGMYWLIRRWGLGGFAAAFAGFAYVFNGVTLSCLMWISYTAFLAWSPWVLGCTMSAWRQGGRWIPLAALASAMQVLAGAPELTLLFWMLVGLLWLSEAVGRGTPTGMARSGNAGSVPFWHSAARLAAVVGLAAGITMVQMLPFFDLLAHSQRDLNFGGNTWAMPGWGWANLLVPLFHCYFVIHGPWFQPGQYLVSSYYLGVGVLVLAIAGAWLTRRRTGVILGGLALFCWIMALGSNGFLFGWIKRVLPWVGIARYPVKFAFFPVLLVPLGAAWAIQAIVVDSDRKQRRVLIVLGAAVLLLMGGLLWFARAYPLRDDQWAATAQNTIWRALLLVVLVSGVLWLAHNQKPSLVHRALQIALLALAPLDAFTHNPGLAPTLPAAVMVPGVWTLSGKPAPPKLGEGRVMASPAAERQFKFGGTFDRALLLG